MLSFSPALHAAFAAGASVWPLVAGLSIVLWSKARAVRPQPIPIRIRNR